jgi:hypothetical protein
MLILLIVLVNILYEQLEFHTNLRCVREFKDIIIYLFLLYTTN